MPGVAHLPPVCITDRISERELSWRESILSDLHFNPHPAVLSHLNRDKDVPHSSLESFGLHSTRCGLRPVTAIRYGEDCAQAWIIATHNAAPVEKRDLLF